MDFLGVDFSGRGFFGAVDFAVDSSSDFIVIFACLSAVNFAVDFDVDFVTWISGSWIFEPWIF